MTFIFSLYFLLIRLTFANLVFRAQKVLCQAVNYSGTILDMYICHILLSHITYLDLSYLANILANNDYLLISDFYHLAHTLTNTNDIPMIYFYYLATILTNINGISKIDFHHLANILTNTNDKANNFIRIKILL